MNSNTKGIQIGIIVFCLFIFIYVIVLVNLSLGEDNQYESFKKWAVDYAIQQQKASEFQLTPYEEMDHGELRNLIEKEWMEKWNQICPKNPTLEEQEQAIKEYNAALMPFFRESLSNGHHSEAWNYFSLLRRGEEDASLLAASREAYDAYIDGYGFVKLYLGEIAVAELIAVPYDCPSLDGKNTSTEVHLTTEGVKLRDPDAVTELYAGPVDPRDWPTFPALQATFGLSDGSDSPLTWNNFVEFDIRHFDRTPGDSMRDRLDWLVRSGSYESIINEEGLEAAEEAFRDNFSISYVAEDRIGFEDSSSNVMVDFQLTDYGMIQIDGKFDCYNRCTAIAQEDIFSDTDNSSQNVS
jgi:hypothetical protein